MCYFKVVSLSEIVVLQLFLVYFSYSNENDSLNSEKNSYGK